MNKSALKKFATEARKELLERVELQARKIGITAESIQKANVESSDAVFIDGRQLSDLERRQRNKLIVRINEIGFDRVMEETAYTWFNRFIALRFMEVNDYLPTKVRVLSSSNDDSAEPDMMKEALSLDLELDKEYVYELKINNKTDELFKYLIKMHCNDLNRYMPFMFETLEDYKEILFPEGLLGTDSFVRQLTDTEVIPEDNWEKIEIIGWLYQYYIADEKDRVFKAKAKYKAEEIPYATQLFTPDWIVQYMVQNSLGRYWTEAHPEHEDLIMNWEYFLKHQQEDFQEKIAPYINKELNVEDIKCFDPAMGSGHILVYMFDVLYEIYSKCGYMEREIPRLIIEKNLYGLDIDDRAYQLASFSIVMKALQYNRRFLRSIEREGLTMNLASIQETNGWTDEAITYIAGEEAGEQFNSIKAFFEQYKNAKTFGSLIKVTVTDISFLDKRLKEIKESPVTDLFQEDKREQAVELLPLLIKQTKIMEQQYDIVVMNPPYMGAGSMNKELSEFLRKNYPDSKLDLFASFMEVDHYIKQKGFYAAINQHSWMFLTSFEKLREKVIFNKSIDSMLHLGPRAFEEIGGEVVQSTAFVLRNTKIPESKGMYLRLIEERTAGEKRDKAKKAVQNPLLSYRFSFNQENFSKIPGSPIAYWISEKVKKVFEVGVPLEQKALPKQGMATCDNNRFLRFWFEINYNKMKFNAKNAQEGIESKLKWFPYHKGGTYRKWSGNFDYVVNWENNGSEIREYTDMLNKDKPGGRIKNEEFYFKTGLTWSALSSGSISFRYFEEGFLFDTKGSVCFPIEPNEIYYIAGLLNSKVVDNQMKILAPTLDYNPQAIRRVPYIENNSLKPDIIKHVKNAILISKKDWDSFEISWDFKQHPLTTFPVKQIEFAYQSWKQFAETQFYQLKFNEEELNRIFIKIYDLQEELSPEVDDADITIRKANLERDIKSFISYAIGCSFGRYSPDEEGIVYAGGEFDASRYKTFPTDEDNILPILPGAYFKDDIVTRFVDYVQVTFSEETLEENLDFIANAIGRKENETAREALRRYFLNDFYKDHVQVYKKRPIYWLFTSGKEKAFNCLIYMHRYDKTTLSRIRTDYLHEVQIRMDAEKKDLLDIINGEFTAKEISNAKKELKTLDKKIDELKAYDELLHHMADMQIEIDLDDGVKVNYEKFKGLVAKI
jgi:type II restriction/modification system DNA methylase subunit YeeA